MFFNISLKASLNIRVTSKKKKTLSLPSSSSFNSTTLFSVDVSYIPLISHRNSDISSGTMDVVDPKNRAIIYYTAKHIACYVITGHRKTARKNAHSSLRPRSLLCYTKLIRPGFVDEKWPRIHSYGSYNRFTNSSGRFILWSPSCT